MQPGRRGGERPRFRGFRGGGGPRSAQQGARLPDWARWLLILAVVVAGAVTGQRGNWGVGGGNGPAGPVEGIAEVIDGDSMTVGGSEVRLKDIDAPEGRQTCTREGKTWSCGEEARRELKRLIGGMRVKCASVERDKHERLLGYCTAGDRDLNRGMVKSGYALSYGGYAAEEREAKAARRGLWSGEFERPRDWRHDRGIGR